MIEGLYSAFEHWGKGACWITSDTHFCEQDLKDVIHKRPDDEILLKNINQKVGKVGTLIHLGDVGDLEFAKRLKGYKILILGNHDESATKFQGIFDEIYTGVLQIAPHLILSHEPLTCSWAFNLHGHNHNGPQFTYGHMNCCVDINDYMPINLNQFVKTGKLKECIDIHRGTIDKAIINKQKRLRR